MERSTEAPSGRSTRSRPGAAGGDGRAPRPVRPSALNARDRELLRHLADGWSTARIAAGMSVSTNTARTRIRRITAKLGVTGRRDLVATARARGAI